MRFTPRTTEASAYPVAHLLDTARSRHRRAVHTARYWRGERVAEWKYLRFTDAFYRAEAAWALAEAAAQRRLIVALLAFERAGIRYVTKVAA